MHEHTPIMGIVKISYCNILVDIAQSAQIAKSTDYERTTECQMEPNGNIVILGLFKSINV